MDDFYAEYDPLANCETVIQDAKRTDRANVRSNIVERVKGFGAILVTLITGGLAIWWLVLVADRLGQTPTTQNGNVILDEFQRAKDILLVVLPLFSASIAYWVGSHGAKEAKEEASATKQQLDAVLDQGPSDLLKRARETYPEAFSQD